MRQPEELAEEAGSRPKSMSNYLLDLDVKKVYARNKTDMAQREEDLGFVFRAMDNLKWIIVYLQTLQEGAYNFLFSYRAISTIDARG